jgi:hypothetical protein
MNSDERTQQAATISEAESKEKYGVWDPMPELTIDSPYVHSRVDSNTFTMSNPMPESTFYPPVRDFGFGLCNIIETCKHFHSDFVIINNKNGR